jgi:hypothetical protein
MGLICVETEDENDEIKFEGMASTTFSEYGG